jgi:peptide/nickel transport system substrate-binding protein
VLKEYVKGDHVTVVRNPTYWGTPPFYDEVQFLITPSDATRESLLLAGQVDIAVNPPLSDLPSLSNNSDVKVITAPDDRVLFIGINTTTKYLDDPKVRQALNYAIDKDAIIKNVLMGYAQPVDSPMPSDFFGYCKGSPAYTYNPTLAKQLLQEAGVPNNWKLRFVSPTGRYPDDYQVSQAIAGYLQAVGIDAQLKTTDWGTYMSWITGVKPANSTTDLYFLGWSGGYEHGSVTMSMFQTGTFFNGGFYSNPKLDALISAADAEQDPTKSADLYCQANQLVWSDAPWIFLYHGLYPVIQSTKIQGLIVLPSEKFDTSGVTPVQ